MGEVAAQKKKNGEKMTEKHKEKKEENERGLLLDPLCLKGMR
jgi:hypothetical protein